MLHVDIGWSLQMIDSIDQFKGNFWHYGIMLSNFCHALNGHLCCEQVPTSVQRPGSTLVARCKLRKRIGLAMHRLMDALAIQ